MIDPKALYAKLGGHAAGRLHCETCQQTRTCTPGDAAFFLREGWPLCCGYTMTLLTVTDATAPLTATPPAKRGRR